MAPRQRVGTTGACLWTWAVLAMLAAANDARALDAPASYRYRIHHEVFGDLGEHRMTVRREDGAIVVEHAAELAVEILGFTIFRRRSQFREVWREDRLVEFDGLIEDNGEPFPVRARAEGDHLLIESSAGRIEAPPRTVPNEPSLESAIQREWFFDSKTGELVNAAVTPAGREPLKVGQDVVDATKYEVSGELEQHVWFDATGAWVQWRMWREGAEITLVRE